MSAEISAREAFNRTFSVIWHAEPKLLVTCILLSALTLIPAALTIVWLGLMISSLVNSNHDMVVIATFCLILTSVAGWLLRVYSEYPTTLFNERATIGLEAHIAKLQSQVSTIEYFERSDYLNHTTVLKDQLWRIVNVFTSFSLLLGAAARLAITLAILIYVDVWLLLLTLFAIPIIWVSKWRGEVMQATWMETAKHKRVEKSLFKLGLDASSAKELRIAQTRKILSQKRRELFNESYRFEARQRLMTSLFTTGSWVAFVLAYVGSIYYLEQSHANELEGILLVLIAGVNLVSFLTAITGSLSEFQFMVSAAKQLAWLERQVNQHELSGSTGAPDNIKDAITLNNVSFSYPETQKLILDNINLRLPSGSVIAVVGENGAGKSTLVKLLARLYEPTEGNILVDDTQIRDIYASSWQSRISGAFQDATKFEYQVKKAVGIGELSQIDDINSINLALEEGAATSVIEDLSDGLDTQLGAQWPNGVELSGGQWQRIALARGMMKEKPLLLIFDEPTASLDPETEYELFNRFSEIANREKENSTIVILVSHRFSTVRMADEIIVLNKNTIEEQGTHEELMEANGTYAELFSIQEKAYKA